ncbi:MAG: hypothetical protein GWN84_20675 [Gammaproteobacteria bacterium]|nr:hypothetical protein [Gammaproteobacteria bacterium]NIR85176.1 hypothetical protein [Gammaproteobacteria bacterium]NIU06225.1 hypothetical protein [Gammaproteobacteria bacterium]NIX87498.1 hypothetical protein [Gammaproteobacteria bacterium]
MTARAHVRGHPIYWDGSDWRYEDTNEAVSTVERAAAGRACAHTACTAGRYEGDVLVDIGLAAGPISVDPCIADLVQALNATGLPTVASCCGHGRRPGRITLKDGRELHVTFSQDAANELQGRYPDIHGRPIRRRAPGWGTE